MGRGASQGKGAGLVKIGSIPCRSLPPPVRCCKLVAANGASRALRTGGGCLDAGRDNAPSQCQYAIPGAKDPSASLRQGFQPPGSCSDTTTARFAPWGNAAAIEARACNDD